MEFTEEKIYAAFGLEKPAAETPAQPMQEPAQQPATQPQTEPNAGNAISAQPETNAVQEPGSGQELTPQQRRENAARRRQQELEAAKAQAVEAALASEREKNAADMKDFFAKAGLKNSYTGEAITNMDQFKFWYDSHSAQQMERDLKAGKLTPQMLERAISQHPAVQQAQQMIAQQHAQEQARLDAAEQAKLEAELQKIYAIDPMVKTPEDLLNLPTADAFKAYVDKGYSFEDAHYLANRERLEAARADAARQQALNDVRSKSHLTPDGNSRGSGAATVPADEMAMFRLFNPSASEADIIAYYNKNH